MAAQPLGAPRPHAARLRKHYAKTVVPALTKRFSYKNPMQVPRLREGRREHGSGRGVANPKLIDSAVEDMRAITGLKPVVTRRASRSPPSSCARASPSVSR